MLRVPIFSRNIESQTRQKQSKRPAFVEQKKKITEKQFAGLAPARARTYKQSQKENSTVSPHDEQPPPPCFLPPCIGKAGSVDLEISILIRI